MTMLIKKSCRLYDLNINVFQANCGAETDDTLFETYHSIPTKKYLPDFKAFQ